MESSSSVEGVAPTAQAHSLTPGSSIRPGGTWTDITPMMGVPGPPMRYGSGAYDPINKIMLMVPGEWGQDIYAFMRSGISPTS
jgi:hypothetical protein